MPRNNSHETVNKIIGEAYRELLTELEIYAEKERPVLLIGESGTGKELLARHYMKKTGRDKKDTITCAGNSGGTLASELFGHVKGAFTGAVKDRDGIFQAHNGGTLFLDEIGDADDALQASLLRVIQHGDLRPVGADESVTRINVLVVAATNRPENVRSDLKSRFRNVYVPTLQKFDIPALVNEFMGGFPPDEIMDDLIRRDYPCNIRDLETACEDINDRHPSMKKKKRIPIRYKNTVTFDYKRYIKEMKTWISFIQPVFKELKTHNFKYRYIPDPTPVHDEHFRELIFHADKFARYKLFGYTNSLSVRKFLFYIENKYLPEVLTVIEFIYDRYCLNGERHNRENDNTTPMIEDIQAEFIKALNITDTDKATERMRQLYLQYHVARNDGNKSNAAEALGISRNTLYRKIKQLSQ